MRALCLALLLLALPAGATPLQDEVTATLRADAEAWSRGDLDAFMGGYLDSPDLTLASGGEVLHGFDTLRSRYRQTYGKDMGLLRFENVEVTALGADHALAVGKWFLAMPDGVTEFDYLGAKFSSGTQVGGIFSLVLCQTPQGWKILHDHTTTVPPPTSPAASPR